MGCITTLHLSTLTYTGDYVYRLGSIEKLGFCHAMSLLFPCALYLLFALLFMLFSATETKLYLFPRHNVISLRADRRDLAGYKHLIWWSRVIMICIFIFQPDWMMAG